MVVVHIDIGTRQRQVPSCTSVSRANTKPIEVTVFPYVLLRKPLSIRFCNVYLQCQPYECYLS